MTGNQGSLAMPVSRSTPIDSNPVRVILIIFSPPFYRGVQEGAMLHRDTILGPTLLTTVPRVGEKRIRNASKDSQR
jgi:hypothetical protein